MSDDTKTPNDEGAITQDSSNNNQTTNSGNQQEDFSTLLDELETSKAKLAELTQISQQALADLQNFKKRSEEEKIKFVAFANATLITELLPILDSIDRATAHLPQEPAVREWVDGIVNIFKKLTETLSTRGLEIIPTDSQAFDPNLHEAVMTENGPHDQIIKELEKGYRMGDKVLRRARVTVGNGQELPVENPPSESTQ
jgi:molecular chaperone GrpE